MRHWSLQNCRDLPRSPGGSGLPHPARLQHPPSPAGTLPVSSRPIWRGWGPLTCGAPLADGVVIAHGLSFDVAVFGNRASAGAVEFGRARLSWVSSEVLGWMWRRAPELEADLLEPGAVVSDPPAERVVEESPAGVRRLADCPGGVLVERRLVPAEGYVAAPVQVGEERGERDCLGEGRDSRRTPFGLGDAERGGPVSPSPGEGGHAPGLALGEVLGHVPGGDELAPGPRAVAAAGQEPREPAVGVEDVPGCGQVMLGGLAREAEPAPVTPACHLRPAGQDQDVRPGRA